MKRRIPLTYPLLVAAILLLMSLSKMTSEKIRGVVATVMSPLWNTVTNAKMWSVGVSESGLTTNEELQRLRLENQQLIAEIDRIQELFRYERLLTEPLFTLGINRESLHSAFQQHQKNLQRILTLQLQALPARVIFRSPSSWHSSLWVNVGSNDNVGLEAVVVAKNSPVVFGTSVVGVIDYVGTHQSRVRLITDSGLKPSVRALRSELALAKGELYGSGSPLWRSQGNRLHGVGFNYDFPDNEGPARDLRSGKPLEEINLPSVPIIQEKDLLVTTGMDGVFPPGLQVAEVTRVYPLEEGDYSYEIEAKPTAGDLDNLSLVFVMPPISLEIDRDSGGS